VCKQQQPLEALLVNYCYFCRYLLLRQKNHNKRHKINTLKKQNATKEQQKRNKSVTTCAEGKKKNAKSHKSKP
jgi:hypothetical protein